MGYRGEVLRVKFCTDRISERKAVVPVMFAHIRERQEALAAARTHGKIFFVMGGEHVTLNNMFKAVKINRWIKEATKKAKEEKSRVEYYAWCKATLPILYHLKNDIESDIAGLTSQELEILLK
jgi:hypothetical protein